MSAVAVSLSVVGFLTGIREPERHNHPPATAAPASGAVPNAVSYSELPKARIRPNAGWERSQSISRLQYERPNIFDPVVRTPEMKLTALADRATNRAYDGAPPTVPHPVGSQTWQTCLACHGEGLKVRDRIASKISHPHMTNCSQCHVEETRSELPFAAQSPANDFVGVYRGGSGERANPGAPPTIPHHTWMRQDCTSCHGLVARPGLRTTHPWLTNCVQCHAPSATLDQANFTGERK
jgi:cytochrome c-type protein NapB